MTSEVIELDMDTPIVDVHTLRKISTDGGRTLNIAPEDDALYARLKNGTAALRAALVESRKHPSPGGRKK